MMTSSVHVSVTIGRPLREKFDSILSRFLDEKVAEFAKYRDTTELFSVIRKFVLSGGKRLRPLFCYWGFRAAGGADSDGLYAAAASLELLHAFALIHDDIMDGSAVRRGRPTIHHELAQVHEASNWSGDSSTFGINAGILYGDLLMAWSDELLNHCGLPPHKVLEARTIVEPMRSELVFGQHLDLLEQARGGSPDSALTVIRFKSAKYTVERPLQIGGALAGADPALMLAYSAFALPLGEAFQLRDDVLGVFGDPRATGKSTMDDLRAGKATVLMKAAEAMADAHQVDQIRRWHGNPAIGEAGASELREIITSTGALAHVEEMISRRTSVALIALDDAPMTDEARSALRSLAVAATERTV